MAWVGSWSVDLKSRVAKRRFRVFVVFSGGWERGNSGTKERESEKKKRAVSEVRREEAKTELKARC